MVGRLRRTGSFSRPRNWTLGCCFGRGVSTQVRVGTIYNSHLLYSGYGRREGRPHWAILRHQKELNKAHNRDKRLVFTPKSERLIAKPSSSVTRRTRSPFRRLTFSQGGEKVVSSSERFRRLQLLSTILASSTCPNMGSCARFEVSDRCEWFLQSFTRPLRLFNSA